ncbi:MAG: hypothetical protein RLY78_890 [Pseudomonadota bacterium]
MRLDRPPRFSRDAARSSAHHHVLRADTGPAEAHVWVLEEDIVRLMVLPDGRVHEPRTWAIAPGLAELPPEGRDRQDLSGFSLPAHTLIARDGELCIRTRDLELTITLDGLRCRWLVRQGTDWLPAAEDRATQAWNFGWWDERVYHYLVRHRDEQYFGLGERAGSADRHGQRYRMCNLDPMGYDARSTDPLYKHIPFYLSRRRSSGACIGLFYDTLAECTFDMGREMDNYHGHYRHFVAEHGDLDLYMIGGQGPADITARYTWLTGRPAFMPKWSIGYSGSTMSYTDAPDAQARMQEFLDRCAEHDIPCDSFHLSSGYTSIDGKRYVFHWNREKFPDPAAFVRSYLDQGVRLCANIKPALLHDHPRFAEAAAAGLLVQDADGQPTAVQFWDDTGAYLDFTNPATLDWWKARVTEALLEPGIASTWNDNNEYEIWSPQSRIHGFGQSRPAIELRPLQTLLMMQASQQAQQAHAPDERPWLISRSGAPGMQRHVQTWSGDNYTSWDTLRWNIRMGLGLAVSGVSNTGHDIGGFSGPAPEPELLLRWVQHGIFLPRFSIHSWNDDRTVNEPWMYPQITPTIRALIALRVRLTPYLYQLLWRSHSAYAPIIRPTFHDFPADAQCWEENDDMLLGADLLVPSVVEPGATTRRVWLPAGADWCDFWSGQRHAGGQWITLDAPLMSDRPPLLARAGSAIPLNVAQAHFARQDDARGFQVFPPAHGEAVSECFEDDGHSTAWSRGAHGFWRLGQEATADALRLTVGRVGPTPPATTPLQLRVPQADGRTLAITGARVLDETTDGGWRVLTVQPD